MATTKRKSSGAKNKTAKKPATKSARVSKKSVSKKAVRTQAVAKQKTIASQINVLNILSVVLGLALAGAAGFLMGHNSYQLFVGLLTRDELASRAITIFVPAIHAVYDLELRWAVVAIMMLTVVAPLLVTTRYQNLYSSNLKKKTNWLRWLDMAVISALMVEIIALLSGVQDIAVLKVIGGLMVVTCGLGWLADKQNAESKKPAWSAYVISLVTGSLPWVLIAIYAVSTYVYGLVRSPWFVYALYATSILGFVGYAIIQARQIKGRQSYEATERNYLKINLFVRVTFAVILIIGLQK